MNIRFLGTGFGPSKIKKKNTKDYRRPASLLIDDRILIDPSDKILEFLDDYSLGGLLSEVHTILVTAADACRVSAETLLKIASSGKEITIYGHESVFPLIPEHSKLRFQPVCPNEIFDAEGGKVIALSTLYKTDTGAPALGYAICTDRSLLYLSDGGFLHPDAWALMQKLRFDHAILGCPEGDRASSAATVSSSNFELARMLRAIFLDAKMLSPTARCFLTAIPADKKRSVHDALVELSRPVGITVAYDGLYMSI